MADVANDSPLKTLENTTKGSRVRVVGDPRFLKLGKGGAARALCHRTIVGDIQTSERIKREENLFRS